MVSILDCGVTDSMDGKSSSSSLLSISYPAFASPTSFSFSLPVPHFQALKKKTATIRSLVFDTYSRLIFFFSIYGQKCPPGV